jgi:hypothetical protein
MVEAYKRMCYCVYMHPVFRKIYGKIRVSKGTIRVYLLFLYFNHQLELSLQLNTSRLVYYDCPDFGFVTCFNT